MAHFNPIVKSVTYSESETDQMYLLKYFTGIIHILSDSNIILMLQSVSLETYSQDIL